MKITRLTALIAALTIALTLFCGCTNIYNRYSYGAEMIGDAEHLIKKEFAEENPVDVCYVGINNPLPGHRTFIVNTREEYDRIFADGIDLSVDFDLQTVIVYTHMSLTPRECFLYDLYVEDNVLKVVYRQDQTIFNVALGDGVCPYQRWFVITLDKAEFESVEFEKNNKVITLF